jgi:tetratricopeptide (TPR) repeat protein
VIAFQRGRPADAERHFRRTLDLDPYGSHTDLGALYARTGRYNKAETELNESLTRDRLDFDALVELGYLYLQPGYENLPAAERAFLEVLASQPDLATAAVGHAQVLTATGRATEAEVLLRRMVRQEQSDGWRVHLALARLLVQQGSEQRDPDQLSAAAKQAQLAIDQASKLSSQPTGEEQAELHFVAGAAQFYLASLTPAGIQCRNARHHARQSFDQALRLDENHVEALRYRSILDRTTGLARQGRIPVRLTAAVAFVLLSLEWILFLTTSKISATLLATDTPILLGLFVTAFLLPTLIHIKMPGFEAEVQPNHDASPPAPTGAEAFGPGRFTVTPGPSGQTPRRGADLPHKKFTHVP